MFEMLLADKLYNTENVKPVHFLEAARRVNY